MIEINVQNVEKFYSGKNLLDGLTFQIHRGERVGLLGKNGTGKTTLFKILTGTTDYHAGSVSLAQNRTIGLIDQIPEFPDAYTVLDVLNTAFETVRQLEQKIETLIRQMQNNDDEALLKAYGDCMAAYEAAGGYDTAVQLERLCEGWRLTPEILNQPFNSLSGGERTRINLARLILQNTDILLLDEPTNHLDIHMTEWLEKYLAQFKGTVLTISHDRYFLDRVVTRIIELKDGKAEFYSGNYTFYAEEKERRYQEQLAKYNNEQAKIKQLESAAEKLRVWAFKGMDKTYKRAISMEKRIERIRQTEKPDKERVMTVGFSAQKFRGDCMLTVEKLGKSFDHKALFSNVNLRIRGGERIALIGDNGSGKSTLLKILLGEETPDTGTLTLGPSVVLGCLPQLVTFNEPSRSLLDTMMTELDCPNQTARDRLAAFRFREDDVFKPISALSGGERARFKLCMLMDDALNLLILDEPTNHLDIGSREWIERALDGYKETLLFVSHDRYFIERFATQIWALKDGKIQVFDGGYQAYLEDQALKAAAENETAAMTAKKEKNAKTKSAEIQNKSKSTPETNTTASSASNPKPFIKRPEKQLAAVEKSIETLEKQQKILQEQMQNLADHYEQVQSLYATQQENEKKLAELYAQWEMIAEYLSNRSN